MSRCFYLKTEYCVDFIGMQETLEMIFNCDSDSIEYPVEFYELEPSEGEREAACFYIKGESAKGVQVINKEGYIIIKINSLCNYKDYKLARTILILERDFLKTQILDENNAIIIPEEYFTDERIQKLIEEDAKAVEEEDNYQYHGNHWNCILDNPENDIIPLLSESIEKGSLYGHTTCDYTLEEKLHGPVAILEYDKGDRESAIVIRNVIAADNNKKSNSLVSGFPVIKGGNRITLKISKIQEWENGLEGWITAELVDGRWLTFFDTGFAINKDKYEIGKNYDFIIGALAYSAHEPESKGFTFEGQKAIDFKAKFGEEPEYDENGNVKPIEFSTEQLCAFLQRGHAPDEAEFITTVDEVRAVKAFGKDFWKFDVIYRSEEDDGIKIPTFVIQSNENQSIKKAKQLQGILWLTGYLA